jgi:hypothetical protein
MKKILLSLSTIFIVQGCVVIEGQPCEDLLEVKRQEQMCAKLRRQMNNKDSPQAALTAKLRYEEACVNLRYYRDDFDTICKSDEKPVGKQ